MSAINFVICVKIHKMKSGNETKILLGILALTLGIIVLAVFLLTGNKSQSPNVLSQSIVRDDNYFRGPRDVKATIVEFSNFECGACKAMEKTIEQIFKDYEGKVKLVYKHFPFEEPGWHAELAAEAAEAAGAQGKFWEMHDLLFENQGNLGRVNLTKLAQNLSLDVDKFNKDLDQGTYKAKVQKDLKEAQDLGLDSTPTFFVNGKQTQSKDLAQEIDRALQ